MTCPRCSNGMHLNGSMWQCDACGYLSPNSVVPQDRSALKAILARAARRNRAALDRLSR